MSHNLKTLAVSRYGCWAVCTCGWKSGNYAQQAGAQWAFGNHLTTIRQSLSPAQAAGAGEQTV